MHAPHSPQTSSAPAVLTPHPTGAIVRPRFIEDERTYGARNVHTVVLFTAPGGWGAATALRLKLQASAAGMFDVTAFGAVYVRAVSGAYLVSTIAGGC